MRIRISFLRGPTTIATVDAAQDIDRDALTVADMEAIIPTEQLLEKLTGLRVHIEQVPANDLQNSVHSRQPGARTRSALRRLHRRARR